MFIKFTLDKHIVRGIIILGNYKLVVIDLDGTLLDSNGQISEKTKNSIKKAMEKGVDFVIASRQKYRFNKNFFKRAWN